MALEKIKMKTRMRIAVSPGATMDAKEGMVIECQGFTAKGLVDQGFAEYVKEGTMIRTSPTESKAEMLVPENKDEGRAPEDKEEGFVGGGEKLRVHELAKKLGVKSRDILIQAAQLGIEVTSPASSLTDDEAHRIIQNM